MMRDAALSGSALRPLVQTECTVFGWKDLKLRSMPERSGYLARLLDTAQLELHKASKADDKKP
jgi:hypothetical protein